MRTIIDAFCSGGGGGNNGAFSSCRRSSMINIPRITGIPTLQQPQQVLVPPPTSSTLLHMHVMPQFLNPIGGSTVEHNAAIAGKIIPLLSNFHLSSSKLNSIKHALVTNVDPLGFMLLVIISWGFVPTMEYFFNYMQRQQKKREEKQKEKQLLYQQKDFTQTTTRTRNAWNQFIDAITLPAYKRQMNFEDSIVFQIGSHISQLATLGSLVYVVDVFAIILKEMGFKAFATHVHNTFGGVCFTLWLSWRLKKFKRFLLMKSMGIMVGKQSGGKENHTLGKVNVYDRILNLILYIVTGTALLEQLSLEWGFALKGVFAFGGISTVVISLAAKDLATQLLSGIALSTSDKFYAGEKVKFGDGTQGSVEKIGWMHTLIRASDETLIRIPNTQIVGQRVANMSRVPRSQVKQILRLNYADIRKIPKLIKDIKRQMKHDFPTTLITDGSRPFHVHWVDLAHDHLEVECDFRFDVPPNGTQYKDIKQQVIMTLARVVDENGMEFALPSVVSRNVEVANNNGGTSTKPPDSSSDHVMDDIMNIKGTTFRRVKRKKSYY